MACIVDIIPIKGDVVKLGSGPILSDGVVLFYNIAHMVSVAFDNVLNTEVINYQDKLDGLPFVALNDRSGGGVILASCVEAIFEEFDRNYS